MASSCERPFAALGTIKWSPSLAPEERSPPVKALRGAEDWAYVTLDGTVAAAITVRRRASRATVNFRINFNCFTTLLLGVLTRLPGAAQSGSRNQCHIGPRRNPNLRESLNEAECWS